MTVVQESKPTSHLSYSQLSTYGECPRKWWLSKRERVPQNTWFATLAGKALHQATEEQDRLEWGGLGYDPVEAKRRFQELFSEQLADAKERGLDVRPSGRKTKEPGWSGGPNKKDAAWWRQFGPLMLDQWAEWRGANGLTIHEIDGLPAIEVPIEFDLVDEDGVSLNIKGFIDRVYKQLGGVLTVVDLKSGAVPSTYVQVETYGLGLEVQYGHKARYGAFWQPGAPRPAKEDDPGGPGYRVYGPVKLHRDPHILADMYHAARRGIEAGAFPPNQRNNCASCGVNKFCTAWNGRGALTELETWREERAKSDSEPDAGLPDDEESDNDDN